MKKKNLLRILTALASGAGALGALDLGGMINLFPENAAVWILAINAAVLGLKEVVVVVGDLVDDGERNNSFLGE